MPEPSLSLPESLPESQTVLEFERQLLLERRSRRVLRRSLAAAVLLHAGLFFVPLSEGEASGDRAQKLVHVFEMERYRPQPIKPDLPTPEQNRKRRSHIVVPGPDVEPVLDDPDVPDFVFGPVDIPTQIPVAPELPEAPPIPVSGDVVAPSKKSGPEPLYPEVARRMRRQGLVILSAVIDIEGRLQELELLKDPGFGMGEAALEAVGQWTFEPALLNGRPVAVVYTLTVHFEVR